MTLPAIAGGVFAAIILVGLRRRVLLRIAFRDFLRRPGQTLLVVIGLLVASVVIAGALVASDSMESLFVENVYGRWGEVDLRVGTIGGAGFTEERANAILDSERVAQLSDGGAARLEFRTTAEAPATGTREPRVGLIGISERDATLGPLDGPPLEADGAVINNRVADALGVGEGDQIILRGTNTAGKVFVVTVSVAEVVPDSGKADWQRLPNVFVSLRFLQEQVGTPGIVNHIVVSAGGPAREPRQVDALGEALLEAASGIADPSPTPVGLRIADSKQADLEIALETSEFFRGLLQTLGGIVALASVALIVNLFVMLGEERRSELGTMRALGMRKGGLVSLGLIEGALYSSTAAVIGSGIGAFLGRYIARSMTDIFSSFAQRGAVEFVRPAFEISAQVLLEAASAGFIISLFAVAFVSFKTSRLSVTSAIRGLPAPRRGRGGRSLGVSIAVALIGAALVAQGPPLILLGAGLLALGAGGALSRWWGWRPAATVASFALLGWTMWAHAFLEMDFDDNPALAFATVSAIGILGVVAAIVLVASNLGALGRLAAVFGSRVRVVVSTAAAYASGFRFKTAMSMAMFGLVLYMIAGFAIWGGLAGRDYEEQSGGFDVFARATIPIEQMQVEGAEAVVPLYAGRYESGYRVGSGSEREQPLIVYGFGQQLVDESGFRFAKKIEGLSDREVWELALAEPGKVIMDTGSAPGSAEIGDQLELKTDIGDVKLEVVGILDEFIFSAAFMSKPTYQQLFPGRAADTVWLIRPEPGRSHTSMARELEKRFAEQGMDARSLQQVFDEAASTQRTFVGLFQLLLKAGLLIGISGLAIGAVRSVLERRQMIGVLRAIGFRRSMVASWLLLESLLIATLGIAVGLGVGLLGIYLVISEQVPELPFNADWGQITSTLILVYAAVWTFTLVPALRAASLRPSEAVRYVE